MDDTGSRGQAGTGDGGSAPAFGGLKLAAGGLGFVLLTVAVFWYQFQRIQPGDVVPRLHELRWSYLVLILLCLPVESATSALRLWLLCRVLEPGVGLWTCVKAEWANAGISTLTPSQSGGGPGQIYMLNRGGVSVGTAVTVSLLSFVGTMSGLLLLGLYSLAVSGVATTGRLLASAVSALTGISALVLLGATCPGLFRVVLGTLSRVAWRLGGRRYGLVAWRPAGASPTAAPTLIDALTARLVDLVYGFRDDVRRLLRSGKLTCLLVCLLSTAFLVARALMPYLCVRFLGLEGATLREIVDAQLALIFLVFFAPTPGGAGVAETASLTVMAGVVPAGFAPYYNLLWRFATVYLAALAGLACLARALARDARHVGRPPDAGDVRASGIRTREEMPCSPLTT